MPTQPEPPNTLRLMDYAEAAAALGGGITEHWLRKAVRERRIPHTRMSDRVIRFTESDIRSIFEQHRVEPAPVEAPRKSTPTPTRGRKSP